MSTVYNLEPPPTAKAVLHTTAGDILLELFAQQTPLASRSFLQHCLDGYYDNTLFHRLVPGFIIQGGDPTGTGSGGDSALDGGAPFADEFHSRLKFNRRGLLGMANTGGRDENGSQFFLTLGKTEELTGRNTMFGRVEGNTIYNLVKMGEAELMDADGSERPMYPTMITATEILVNPFADMVKRARLADRTLEQGKPPPKKKPKKKPAKQMLSFGDDDDAAAGAPDLANAPKFNPKLVQADKSSVPSKSRPAPKPVAPAPASEAPTPAPAKPTAPSAPVRSADSPSPTPSPPPEPEESRQEALLARTDAKIANLKQSLKRTAPAPRAEESTQKASGLDAMVPEGATRGRKRKADELAEQRALADFNAFKARLETAASAAAPKKTHANGENDPTDNITATVDNDDDDEGEPCELHFVPNCQSCRRWDAAEDADADDDDVPESVLSHRLTFAKDRLGKSLEWKRQNEKELVVIDPREREKDILKKDTRKKGRA